MVVHPAALDLPHALVEWVAMLIVTREGDRRCKLRPSLRAMPIWCTCAITPRWQRSPPGSGSVSPPLTPTPARSSTCSPNEHRVC